MKVGGRLRVPGDKSISHRALMLAVLGDGPSRITRILESADVQSTAGALRALGADVPPLTADLTIPGIGAAGLRAPGETLDCGNSGTTTRLMSGIVAGRPITATFVGDASLSRRPMRRVAAPLERMGARVTLPPHGGLPMTVSGGALRAIDFECEVASAQVKSAILLAALVAGVDARVHEPEPTRDHTERMLAARGASLGSRAGTVELRAATRPLAAMDIQVPGDPSSAAFFAALAAMADEGTLVLEDVCVNPTRTGFFDALRAMGARVSFEHERIAGGEPVADVRVGPGTLEGIAITRERVPAMIDELPMLACVAAVAAGETRITGAGELRVKESDRIAAVVANLRAVGADADELDDGLIVRGGARTLRGSVRTHGDHRLAMAFGVLGALDGNAIVVDDPGCTAVSYPAFWRDLTRASQGGDAR